MFRLLSGTSGIVPSRTFNMTYVILDILFLAFLVTLLIIKKKYLTLFWALFGGLLYLAVDFGLFYSVSHTRIITLNGKELDGVGHFLVLLWFSFSYGIPNFTFIWMALGKDKHFWLFTVLIVGWWIVVPTLSQIGGMDALKDTFLSYTITTARTTANFHWIMAAFLVVGYGALIAYFVIKDKKNLKENIKILLWLNLIGFMTQFSWELPLLLNGIRPINEQSIQTLFINSCIETNSGMPYFYLFHMLITKKLAIKENPFEKEAPKLEEVIQN